MEDPLEPIFDIKVDELRKLVGDRPAPKWLDLEEVRRTTVEFEDTDEEEAIEILLTCINARSEEEVAAAKGLVYRANDECAKRGFPDDWLTTMTGLVAAELDLTLDARDAYQRGVDDIVERVQALCDEHLSDIPKEADDPEELWWVMPQANYFKDPKYWPKNVRAPAKNKHFTWDDDDKNDLDILDIARKLGAKNVDTFAGDTMTSREFVDTHPDSVRRQLQREAAAASSSSKGAKGGDEKNKGGDTSEEKDLSAASAAKDEGQTKDELQKAKDKRGHFDPKRRKVVVLEEAKPPPPVDKKAEKKRKRHSLTEIFGTKLNVVDRDPEQKAILETFLAKKKRPAAVDANTRIKIHEETVVDPKTGQKVLTNLFAILDWDKYSFKKTRTQKKLDGAPPTTKTTPQPPPQPPTTTTTQAPPPPAPPPPANTAGVPELALIQDSDDDIPDVD